MILAQDVEPCASQSNQRFVANYQANLLAQRAQMAEHLAIRNFNAATTPRISLRVRTLPIEPLVEIAHVAHNVTVGIRHRPPADMLPDPGPEPILLLGPAFAPICLAGAELDLFADTELHREP